MESCLQACFRLLSEVCRWYVKGRDRDKTGVLCAISALMRDFADFPFYHFETTARERTPCMSMSDTLKPPAESSAYYGSHPSWLADLIRVVDANDWSASRRSPAGDDFDVRARALDLVLYLYVRSASVLEQHAALMTRHAGIYAYESQSARQGQRGQTTVLLKPFMSSMDLERLEKDSLFRVWGVGGGFEILNFKSL